MLEIDGLRGESGRSSRSFRMSLAERGFYRREGGDLRHPAIARRSSGEASTDPRKHKIPPIGGGGGASRVAMVMRRRNRYLQPGEHVCGDPFMPTRIEMQFVARPILKSCQFGISPVIDEGHSRFGQALADGISERVAAHPDARAERKVLRRITAADEKHVDARIRRSIDRCFETVRHGRDRHAWAHDVVAAAVEAEKRGSHRDRRAELFGENGREQSAANREIRVQHRVGRARSETSRDEIGPSAHSAPGEVVTEPLRETVANRYITRERMHRLSSSHGMRCGERGFSRDRSGRVVSDAAL